MKKGYNSSTKKIQKYPLKSFKTLKATSVAKEQTDICLAFH